MAIWHACLFLYVLCLENTICALQFHLLLYLEFLHLLPLRAPTLPISAMLPTLTTDHTSRPSKAKNPQRLTWLCPEPNKTYSEVQKEVVCVLPEKNTRMADEQKLLEERLQRLEQEISHRQASSNLTSSAGRREEPKELYSMTKREWRGEERE